MAKIDITDTIYYPIDKVYPVFRDKLPDLLPYLPTVESIHVDSFERKGDDTVEIVNIWTASESEIPKIAQAFIKKEMLSWTDHATWDDRTQSCQWVMEVGFLTEAISCSGQTFYTPTADGEYTTCRIVGDLTVDAKKIPGVPSLIAGKVGAAIETFVVKMVSPNLKESNRGCEAYLKDQEGKSL